MTLIYTTLDSPIGELLLVGDGHALHRLDMREGRRPVPIDPSWRRDEDAFADAATELGEYFACARREFTLPLALHGNPFELRVWRELLEIPFGATASYGEIARRIGEPSAARAVGLANGRNPVAVIVPCHRVIGADGSLTGYGGGLERKRLLLDLEAGVLPLTSVWLRFSQQDEVCFDSRSKEIECPPTTPPTPPAPASRRSSPPMTLTSRALSSG
jgi:methylated-DNA-[protein]-cysteine S-methyltransferase